MSPSDIRLNLKTEKVIIMADTSRLKDRVEPAERENLLKQTSKELAERIAELQKANEEIQASRRAALNIMEDAIQSRDALLKSEERLRITMESVVDYAIITMNTERTIEQWNTGAERIFGYTAEEVRGKSADIIFTPEDRAIDAPKQEMQTAKERGFAPDERWHLRKDGSRFYMSGVMRPIYNPYLSGFVKVAQDMTNKKAAEQALQISEERHRVALKSAEMGAWDWDVINDKMILNEQHYIMMGLPPEVNVERDKSFFLSYVHPDDVKRVSFELQKVVDEAGVYHVEFRIISKDGKVRWMNGYGRAVAKEGGKATRIVGVMYDITERKVMEQQKDDFIGIASHELKTPVTSIKGYAQVLQEMFSEANNIESASLMHKLDLQVDRLTELIRSLLDTTKISEGQLVLHFELIDMNALIKAHLKDFMYISQKHKLIFKAGEVKNIKGDKERLAQVVTNLVTNAIKYSPNGGEVLIKTENVDENLKVSIKDMGIGIPEEVQSRVFDRFFRVNTPQIQTFPGMGLGLYISAGLVHRHGGTISVTSQPGKGSEFWFTIPYDKSSD
jgi:PAS domain S-box-containing protein